jgi:hypothetical protein
MPPGMGCNQLSAPDPLTTALDAALPGKRTS